MRRTPTAPSAVTYSYTVAEVTALVGLFSSQIVRKELEHGLLHSNRPPRLDWFALVYVAVLAELGLDLNVTERSKLQAIIRGALDDKRDEVAVSRVLHLRLGELLQELRSRTERFLRWKARLRTSSESTELTLATTPLTVRRLGVMLARGVSTEVILRKYPNVSGDDIEFAEIYCRAYPRVGRPRRIAASPSR